MKKALRGTQTLRVKNFRPPQTPFPGAQDHQNLTSWRRSLFAPTDPVWWRSMDAISSYHVNSHRPPARHKHTDRTDYNALHH